MHVRIDDVWQCMGSMVVWIMRTCTNDVSEVCIYMYCVGVVKLHCLLMLCKVYLKLLACILYKQCGFINCMVPKKCLGNNSVFSVQPQLVHEMLAHQTVEIAYNRANHILTITCVSESINMTSSQRKC